MQDGNAGTGSKPGATRIFAPLIAVLLVLSGALVALAWWPLRTSREQWRSGRVAEALSTAQRWSRLRIWPNQYRQLLAAEHLSVGAGDAARPYLDGVRGKRLWVSAVKKSEVAGRLFARGRYEDFLQYDQAVEVWFEPDDTALYRAASLTAVGRFGDAEAALRTSGDFDPKKLEALRASIAQRKQGSYPWIVDRGGQTIAVVSLANGDVVAVNTDFAPLVEKEAGDKTFEAAAGRLGTGDAIETTLDAEVQSAATRALAGFRGSLVAIDPRTSELLAVASTRGNGPLANLAFESQYEPGSIVKVITGGNALSGGVDVKGMFPYHCSGDLLIDGRHLGDWLVAGHGDLPDMEEGLAQSCNVLFADLGIRIGVDRLKKVMTTAGFEGETDLGLFVVPLGKTVGPILNRFETGFYAIGVEHETTNALHLAMLASMMANRGVLTAPRIYTARRSLLGETVGKPPVQKSARVFEQAVAEQMVQAMAAVVASPNGTGRRAAIDGLPIALKTGTAGKREAGYNAVIVAFAPIDHPMIAFGLVAEDAGPAEFAGAKIARDFLVAIQGRLKSLQVPGPMGENR